MQEKNEEDERRRRREEGEGQGDRVLVRLRRRRAMGGQASWIERPGSSFPDPEQIEEAAGDGRSWPDGGRAAALGDPARAQPRRGVGMDREEEELAGWACGENEEEMDLVRAMGIPMLGKECGGGGWEDP